MPARRDERTGNWYFRVTVVLFDGTKRRIFGVPGAPGDYQQFANTLVGAKAAEQRGIQLASIPPTPAMKIVPRFGEWFHGRFWREWVIGEKNKPTEVRNKKAIYGSYLKAAFADLRLDEIDTGKVAAFRASLVEKGLSDKYINNILAVLSKPLHYAEVCEVIAKAPRFGFLKVERPEIEWWDFEQYARLLAAAKVEGADWYAAVALAGEAGLRSGEVKALRWREDVDLIAKTITVNQQTCHGETTTPKGRTRRTIPMTSTLEHALKRLEVLREGFVVRNLDGEAKRDGETSHVIERICRRAGLPVSYWHKLRHSFGTHAALFGVNPWSLQRWLGHKRIDETMLYVHVAEHHHRDIPESILAAGSLETDPDRRIIRMLGARGSHVAAASTVSNLKAVSTAG